MWAPGRMQHAQVVLGDGKMVVNVINAYGPQKSGGPSDKFWPELMRYVAGLGAAPVLIAGDFNCPLDIIPQMPSCLMTEIIAGRLVDLDQLLAAKEGGRTVASFHNGDVRTEPTRIDGVLADPRLATTALGMRALEGVGIPGHVPLLLSIRVAAA